MVIVSMNGNNLSKAIINPIISMYVVDLRCIFLIAETEAIIIAPTIVIVSTTFSLPSPLINPMIVKTMSGPKEHRNERMPVIIILHL